MTNPADGIGGARHGDAGSSTVAHVADNRSYRARRWARLALDDLLDVEYPPAPDPLCTGRHHPGEECDYWRSCTGMALDIPQRHARGRELAAVRWSP